MKKKIKAIWRILTADLWYVCTLKESENAYNFIGYYDLEMCDNIIDETRDQIQGEFNRQAANDLLNP